MMRGVLAFLLIVVFMFGSGQNAYAAQPPSDPAPAPAANAAASAPGSTGVAPSTANPSQQNNDECKPDKDGKMQGASCYSSDIVVSLLLLMTAFYFIQALFAFRKAGRHAIGSTNLRALTFDGGDALSRTWLAAVAILVIPFLLSWIPTLPHMHSGVIDDPRPRDTVAYYGCVSIITVLITVELTLLFDLRAEGKVWQSMLVVAMGLDVASLFLLTGYIEPPKTWKTPSTGWAWAYLALTGASALASSFVIVLFSKAANEQVAPNAGQGGKQ